MSYFMQTIKKIKQKILFVSNNFKTIVFVNKKSKLYIFTYYKKRQNKYFNWTFPAPSTYKNLKHY